MNIEGAVSLGFVKELTRAQQEGGDEAAGALFRKLVRAGYERGSALSVARTLETDDVIDPAETRTWIGSALEAWPAQRQSAGGSAGALKSSDSIGMRRGRAHFARSEICVYSDVSRRESRTKHLILRSGRSHRKRVTTSRRIRTTHTSVATSPAAFASHTRHSDSSAS